MLNAISRLRPGSPSSSGQSSPEPAPAPTGRHKQLIRRVLQTGPLRGSKKAAQTQHKDSNQLPGVRGPPVYQPPASVYDDDPGIMSEVETSATGIRRASKARSGLPVVRTPSKTQERPLARMTLVKPGELGNWQDVKGNQYKEDYTPSMSPCGGIYANNELASRAAMITSLGLVFLQYRSETKRALLPNEITSIDTVKALFVRSFPKQLTMEYLDSPHIRIYIHDASKDMFYELEDLRDIRDRSVLRIYEQDMNDGAVYSTYDQDMSYFSEPEFDSEYQNQHIHRAKASKTPQGSSYYGVPAYAARTQTLPHGATMRPFSPAPPERPKPPSAGPGVGYSQTLPRGMTYASVALSPEKRQPGLLVPAGGVPIVPPSKPARFYQQPVSALSPLTSPRCPLPRPPSAPPPRSMSPERGPEGGMYSSGLPFTSPTGPQMAMPRRYELGFQESPERKPGDLSNFLSSPERRMDHQRSLPATFNSAYEEPFYGDQDQLGSRSGSATPIIDEEARMRVEYMERQLASLTGLVHKALAAGTSPRQPSHLIPTRDTDGPPEKDRSDEVRLAEHDVQKHPFKEEKSVSFSEETTTLDSHKRRQHSPQPAAEKPSKPAIKSLRSHSITDKDGRPSKPAPPPKPASLSGALDSRQHSSSPAKEVHFSPEVCSQLQHLRKQTKDLRLEVRNLRRMTQAQTVTAREMIREVCLKIKVMLAAVQVGDDQVCAERLRVSREEDLYRQDVTRLEKDLSDLESQVEELRGNVINRRCRVNMSNVESMALVLSRASKTVADLKARFPNLQDSLKTVMGAEMEVVVREEKFLKEEPERLENALRRCKKLTGTLVTLKRLASVQEQRHTGAHGLPEKAASADGAYSDGEAHTARSVEGDGASPAGRSENALDALLDELQTFSKDKRRPAESPVRAVEASSKKTPPPPPPRTTSKSPVTSPTGPQRSRSEPVRTSALACEEGRRDQLSSNSSSSESVNSQEGLQGRSRQELLDSRHQELLRKQRQLQEQYARLQLLQRLSPPKPDLKKTGSESNILHKASLAMASASGSLTHLAIPPSASPGAAAALLRSGAKIYETDIL
ncbi:coiled-coil domain-containing protein AGAP005037 isoform X3 [Ixodes scapularis]|uniref:coiled-coil domain-containing protein AGAP005037 isoform X3 n=1 Tax=Ixodes scapularis TaxID=6945 RepID=UPI001A9DE9EA|nr:coiled-coil domain-containing protein AGAP005037 isoform X3 [Ixodes scapularis]